MPEAERTYSTTEAILANLNYLVPEVARESEVASAGLRVAIFALTQKIEQERKQSELAPAITPATK